MNKEPDHALLPGEFDPVLYDMVEQLEARAAMRASVSFKWKGWYECMSVNKRGCSVVLDRFGSHGGPSRCVEHQKFTVIQST